MKARSALLLIFTLSGFSGLIYESIWTHYIKLLLGHAAYAQTLVLSIFLGGLALGSWLSSRFLSRIRNPLTAYVLAEVFLGVMGFAFHRLFDSSAEAFYAFATMDHSPAATEIVKWSLATALIAPQAIVLGFTFPWLSAALIRLSPGLAGSSISLLYFTNSIGGAIGALASGFLLIAKLGLPGTLMTAAAINIVIAAAVWPLTRKPEFSVPSHEDQTQSSHPSRPAFTLLSIALLTGLASFYYEIAWIRMLSLVLSSSTQSFELMLSAFITGLAFGGLWVRKRVDVIGDLVKYLGYVQLLMGLFAVLTMPLYVLSFEVMAEVIQRTPKNDTGYIVFSLVSHLICLAVMLPATFMAGMTLPLLSRMMIRGPYGESAVGYVYAFNTLGGILGVLTAVHVLIVTIGVKYLIVAGALIDIALGCWLLLPGRDIKRLAAIGAVVALVSTTIALQRFSPEVLASGVYRHGHAAVPEDVDIIYYEDGKTASIAVTKVESRLSIKTNGKPDGSIDRAPGEITVDEPTMILLGALPIALKPEARQIANIGFGTGLTSHTLLGSPHLTQLDTIEIEPKMIEGARLFGNENIRAYEDPRSRLHIDDAKSFFARQNKTYDIIVSEPSNPWVSGVANLFSDEFYRHIKPYLEPRGIFVQWLQLYEINNQQIESVFKAIANNFSHFEVFATFDADMLIIAADQSIPEIDGQIFEQPALAASLKKVGIETPLELKLRRIGDESTLTWPLVAQPGPMNSDYFPYVAFSAPRSLFLHESAHTFYAKLRFGPIPVLAIMNDLPIQKVDVSEEEKTLSYYLEYQAAKATVDILSHPGILQVEKLPENKLINRILNLRNHCKPSDETIKTLYDLADRINPYMPAADVLPLWQTLETFCQEKILKQWIRLHASIVRRDYRTMAAISQSLIHSEDFSDTAQLGHYAWTAWLLSNYKLERYQRAAKLIENYNLPADPVVFFLSTNLFGQLSKEVP